MAALVARNSDEKIYVGQYCLVFQRCCLDVKRALSDYEIKDESTLQLVPVKIPINIQILYSTGNMIPFTIYFYDYVKDIKILLQERKSISPDWQILSFAGEPLKDDCQVCDFGIIDGSVIELALG